MNSKGSVGSNPTSSSIKTEKRTKVVYMLWEHGVLGSMSDCVKQGILLFGQIGESNKGSSLVSKTKNDGSNPSLPAKKLSCDATG